MPTSEQKARFKIGELLEAAGWDVQDRKDLNLYTGKSGVHDNRSRVSYRCWAGGLYSFV